MYLMFDRQFADKIKNGTKRSTIRRSPKREFRIGQTLDLRSWLTKPYRSKMETLAQVEIERISRIVIQERLIVTYDESGGRSIRGGLFIDREGFGTMSELIEYIRNSYGLPFEGILIEW